jgi:3-dehydroquinate synthase
MKKQSFRGEYEVEFISDVYKILQSELTDSDVVFVDENVAKIYDDIISLAINGRKHEFISPTESSKSYEALVPIIDNLIRGGVRKNHRLIAIGGGITQDVVSFISSVLYRGIDWVFIPTSLLAQCDSCIGSKTSINFRSYKNQIGGFHPPRHIFISLSFLKSLPIEERRSGLGEMMHYFFISGRKHFELIKKQYEASLSNDDILESLIHESLKIKKEIIEIDEFDCGPRNVFNYGHSFGHALESYTEYSIRHGIAVTYGMDIANHLSVALGYLDEKECQEMSEVLTKNWGAMKLPNIRILEYIEYLKKDKKNVDKNLRVVLSRGIGDMFLAKIQINNIFRETLDSCFARYC